VNLGFANTTVDFDTLMGKQDVKASVLIVTPNAIALEEG